MVKRATIQELSNKLDAVTSELSNAVAGQMSTMRNRIGAMLGVSNGGKRDLYDIYGYDKSLSGTHGFERMYEYSRREGIANRVAWGVAKSSWRDGFEVFTSAEAEADKILVDELTGLAKSKLNNKLERADILNRIGRFSVLFVGVPDGLDANLPIGKVVGNADAVLDQLYFIPYAYDGIEITKQVTDSKDKRFGLPELYSLSRIPKDGDGKDTTTSSIVVHWSRIIHLNENALESDIEGMGALEPIFNRILDLDKTCGGSAEAYFRNAKGKIAFEIDPKFSTDLLSNPTAKQDFQDGAEAFSDQYKDHIVASGSKVTSIDTPHYTPLDTVKVALWGISGYSGIPLRVLTGEGAGQLAGSEDQLAYNQLIKDRQRLVCSGWIYRLFDILQEAGMLKQLPEGYEKRFPVQEAATEKQKAENGSKKADTVLKLTQAKTQPGGDGLDMGSAFAACGLEDIDVEEPDPIEIENPDEPDPGAPNNE